MTVRNIRAHQARGLLDPPEVRMRVGYYGAEHLAQLRLIRELQDDGFNLNGIKRLLSDTEGTAERLLAFKQALSAAAGTEAPQLITLSELGRRFDVSPDEAIAVLTQAQRLGVLVALGEDQFEVPSPSLLALAEEGVRNGIDVTQRARRAGRDRAPRRLGLTGVRRVVPRGGVEAVCPGRHAG